MNESEDEDKYYCTEGVIFGFQSICINFLNYVYNIKKNVNLHLYMYLAFSFDSFNLP